MGTQVILNNVRLRYAHVWDRRPPLNNAEGAGKYEATFLIEPGSANEKKIIQAIDIEGEAAYKKDWPAKKRSFQTQVTKLCYRPGETYNADGFEGMNFIVAKSDTRIAVYDRLKNPVTRDDDILYPGVWVDVAIDVYKAKTYDGIFAGLGSIRVRSAGEPFAGGKARDAIDEFEDLSMEEENFS